MKKFILAVGIPASGKSTAISKLFPEALVVSPDKFIGYSEESPWTPQAARNAWKRADALLSEVFEKESELVVFDATLLRAKKRKKYIQLALKNKYEVVALYCPIPLKISLARNSERSKFRVVPEFVIKDMESRLEVPSKEEGFKEVLIFNSVTNKINE